MLGGVEAGRLFGVRLRLDWSWFAVLILLTWTFATFDFPFRIPGLEAPVYWVLGLSAALLLFMSVLIHELAHALVAQARGIPVERITLFIFGGVAEMRMEAQRPIDEFVLTIVGPLSSLALAGVFHAGALGAAAVGFDSAALLAATLAQLNLILAVFNMVPAFPLDGGRVLRSVLWKLTGNLTAATSWAAGVGRLFAWALMGLGVWQFLIGRTLAGLWAVFLGWFLAGAATSAVRNNRLRALRASLEDFQVSVVLGESAPTVSASMSVEEFAAHALRSTDNVFLVERDGSVVGAVTVESAADIPHAHRDTVPVFEVMTPLAELPRLAAETPIGQAAEMLRSLGDRPALVEMDGQPPRPIRLTDVLRWIERFEVLGG
ncbi:MAG: site-2 protease family protein [Gemmatimonadales bacterium]|nr:MAG: site-2 protease family protein [Gemmatimonadales bacterium]